MVHISSNGICISFYPNSALFTITAEESAAFMDRGMTDNSLNLVLFARVFKVIFATTHTHIYRVVQGTKIQVSQATNSGLDEIKQV
jgi:hypothetical protein